MSNKKKRNKTNVPNHSLICIDCNCKNDKGAIFCTNCGRKLEGARIGWSYIYHEIKHAVFHAEHGFFYTVKMLVISPGVTIARYINGPRKQYQSPISYFILTLFSYSYLSKHIISPDRFQYQICSLIYEHDHVLGAFKLFGLLAVMALIGYLTIGLGRLNYCEVLVVCFYLYGTEFLFAPFFVVLGNVLETWLVHYNVHYKTATIERITDLPLTLLMLRMLFNFSKEMRLKKYMLRFILFCIFGFAYYYFTVPHMMHSRNEVSPSTSH